MIIKTNKINKKLWYLSRTIALFVFTFLLSGCSVGAKNIEVDQAYFDEEGPYDSDDVFHLAYGNMINIDAAVKFKQHTILYDVSNIQKYFGEYEKAVQTIDLALEFSNDPSLSSYKLTLLKLIAEEDEQGAFLNEVLSKQGENFEMMTLDEKLSYNYLLIESQENEMALENYYKILETEVDDSYLSHIYNNMGWAYLNLYDYDNAKAYCYKSLEYEPESSITLYHYISKVQGRGLYSELSNKKELSYLEFATLADDVNELDEDALLTRILDKAETQLSREDRLKIEAYLYYYDEKIDKLFEVSSEIVKINPESGYGHEYLGDAYYLTNDFSNAATHYGLSVKHSEDPYYSSHAQVDALILDDQIEEAERLNKLHLKTYPYDATGYVYQARIEMKMGSSNTAVNHLVTAISLTDYLDNIFDTYEELAPLKGHPKLESIGY